jgi:diadenosine tetraphosphate (Ap4A) HIT family hydrolase
VACPICEKHEGRGALVGPLLYEDDLVLASHAPHEAVRGYLGYVFVETRRHVHGLAGRTESEAVAEARLVWRVARALERAGAEHVYAFVYDHLAHHHTHVVARHPGAPAAYRGVRVDEWPEAPRETGAPWDAYCDHLRSLLAREPEGGSAGPPDGTGS